MAKFQEGQRVRLKAIEDRDEQFDLPEEYGVILEVQEDGYYMVEVDPRYRATTDPDGLRDGVPEDQIEEIDNG